MINQQKKKEVKTITHVVFLPLFFFPKKSLLNLETPILNLRLFDEFVKIVRLLPYP
jgi:hypothetical protein